MPWSKYMIDASHPKVYLDLIDALLKHTSKDGNYLMRDLYVRSELMKYDFTKRQHSILKFIFAASYDYGKDTAIIPNMRDWELCGVQSFKAKCELERLEEMKVISWNRETHEFGITDPRIREAPRNYYYNNTRARELFILNLKHAGIDVDSIIKKSLLEESDKFLE